MSDAAQATAKMNPKEGNDKRFVSHARTIRDGPILAAVALAALGVIHERRD
jgi:hypothetical protein